jgi:hypothetical protein
MRQNIILMGAWWNQTVQLMAVRKQSSSQHGKQKIVKGNIGKGQDKIESPGHVLPL